MFYSVTNGPLFIPIAGVVFYLYLFGISVINLIVIVAAPVSQKVSYPVKNNPKEWSILFSATLLIS